ncbi:MAG: CDP-glycerol glycerophosphotransferase family protein, partial [Lachnospiraceae bacterium]|nr:CDP-glycerol glycerophosphotransferase family protein [Lachnospiraceae bacterium]
MKERDKNIWIYNSGMSFSGNPKWMFMYMLKSHPEVKGVWLCYERKTLSYIKKLGYEAHLFKSQVGKNYMKKAGVYVVNQVKEVIQPELSGITMLNLWHGVGCKPIE